MTIYIYLFSMNKNEYISTGETCSKPYATRTWASGFDDVRIEKYQAMLNGVVYKLLNTMSRNVVKEHCLTTEAQLDCHVELILGLTGESHVFVKLQRSWCQQRNCFAWAIKHLARRRTVAWDPRDDAPWWGIGRWCTDIRNRVMYRQIMYHSQGQVCYW